MKKALFSVSSLWLWHATRTLVLINHFLNIWYEIDIISFWNALNYLKSELNDKKVKFIELEDYPLLERWKWLKFYYYLIFDLVKTNIIIKRENNFVKNIKEKYEFIFSDWRYWVYSKNIPSFLLTHQLAFIMPKWLSIFSKITDFFNYLHFKKFDYIFIPDYENINNSLAWKLSHPKWVNKLSHKYVGILSSFYDYNIQEIEKIDYLFSISWYLLDEKENFINNLLKKAKQLDWKKVFILWDTKKKYTIEEENNITIYSYVSWEQRKKLFLNSQVIISRAWYTTIMDLVELWKKAILFPTPNQTEQEYLAKFLNENDIFVFWDDKSDFNELLWKLNNSKIFNPQNDTDKSIKEIEKIIFKYI